MARRVANHRHSTDIARPKTSVAASTLDARTTAPRAGTDSGISVMSPRLVTEETRPRCEGSIARMNAALSQTDAAPGGEAEHRHRRPPASAASRCPTRGDGQALHDEHPEPRGRAVRRLPADADHAADDRPGREAGVGDAEPVRTPARAADPQRDAEPGDRRDEDVERGQADHEELGRVVAAEVAASRRRTSRATGRGWPAAAGSAARTTSISTAAITRNVAASTSITATGRPRRPGRRRPARRAASSPGC